MNLVFTDVDTPQVHCQRHIYVYPFVYRQNYTSTQLQSPAINTGRGCPFCYVWLLLVLLVYIRGKMFTYLGASSLVLVGLPYD